MSNSAISAFLTETIKELSSGWSGAYFAKSGPLLSASPCPKCGCEKTRQAEARVYALRNGEVAARVELPDETREWTANDEKGITDWLTRLLEKYR